MAAIVDRLKQSADVVIFDTPPVSVVTDAALMAAKSDATIVVIQSHRTSRRVVAQGLEALVKVNARIVGAVLNNVPGHLATPYYGRARAYGEASTEIGPIGTPDSGRGAPVGVLEAAGVSGAAADPVAPVPPPQPAKRRSSSRSRTTPATPPRLAGDLDGANR
jgi:hypothetical protein